jgi:hypothetical protein
MKRLILIAGSSFLILALTLSCQSPVPTDIPNEQYPADISGRVIIAGFLSEQGSIYSPPNDETFWVVDITFTNKAYELPDISGYDHWNIVVGDKYYWIPELLKQDSLPLLNVPANQTEEKMVCFQVPSSLKVGDARLAYQAQKLVSFGRLTSDGKVAGYDWGLRMVVNK